jgi:hypothetical protein
MLTLHRTIRIAVCTCVAVLSGCARNDNAAVDSSGAMTSSTTSTSSGRINLADVAGKWNMKAVPMNGDTTPTTYVLNATSSTSGWTIAFPGRAPVPVSVSVDGDSVMLSAGPYPSVRRKGVTVRTFGTARLQGGSLIGSATAHYKGGNADSVLVLSTSGTRAP